MNEYKKKQDACHYASEGIRINAICPGFTDTNMIRGIKDTGALDAYLEANPMKRLGTVEEIADGLAFLASTMSSYMTGETLVIDGYVDDACLPQAPVRLNMRGRRVDTKVIAEVRLSGDEVHRIVGSRGIEI